MPTDEEIDRSLVEFAQKIAAIPKEIANDARPTEPPPVTSSTAPPAATEVASQSLPPPLPTGEQSDPDIRPAAPAGAGGKQVRHAEEIAGIIMKSLCAIEGCPARGFTVTVYGSNPWNAMLTIRPEAGSGIDRELWYSRVHDIGVRLRNDFDVADQSAISTNGST
ncbi:hypothetical protein KIP88_34760 [Bradyrhizobium sp. SRL28]|uniref:hypothetical protein n=1 Tax=Bradyrhizobium sp. SRL28 TaxID=2836178 RepID=UPI001BDEEB32|nr:hypothetical protein [Bradyrhizobium sp. SRL28]MBT1515644.1 hypothetical protein [Bradyrhizobium sp. SRL28]